MPVISVRISDKLHQQFKEAIAPYGFEESEALRYAMHMFIYELKTRPRIIRAITKFMDRIYLGITDTISGIKEWIDEHTRVGVGRHDIQRQIVDRDIQEVRRKIPAGKKVKQTRTSSDKGISETVHN